MALDILGPFSMGEKSKVIQCKLNMSITFLLQLTVMKTCSVGSVLVTLLFFTCNLGKFCLVHNNEEITNKLELGKTYFVKCVKEEFGDVFSALPNTVVSECDQIVDTIEK